MNWDLIVFLSVDWATPGMRNRQHFLVRALAAQIEDRGRVLAVERPVCPFTGPWRRRAKFVEWVRRRRGIRQESPNLFVCTPIVLLHNVLASGIPGLTRANRKVLRSQLEKAMHHLGFGQNRLVAWLHHPYQVEDIGVAREHVLIYDCYDDYLSNPTGPRLAELRRREQAILTRADVVLVTSRQLEGAVRGRARRVCLVPNGVDAALFAEALRPITEIPADLSALARPVVGFVGKITPRIDFALLQQLVSRRPRWTFALLGPEESNGTLTALEGYSDLRRATNVHFLGARPYEQLPAYLKGFDVCTIPYVLTDFNLGSSPLKLLEYMAAGRPIVSVPIPEVSVFEPHVNVARGANEFELAIANSLAQDGETQRRNRLAVADQNSWARRAQCVLQGIEQVLQEERH